MPGSSDKLNWSRDETIAVPVPEKEGRIAVRRSDWGRCRRNVKRLTQLPPTLSVWYSICFGIAASAGASIIPIHAAKDLPSWVTPLYVCATAATALLGIVIAILDFRLREQRKSRVDDVDADMQEIEESFPPQQ
jgi:hypothetical protein